MTLAEFIKQYRTEHGMSIRSFAAMVGMSPQSILNIERGIGSDGKPMTSTMKTYAKIANAIGMTEKDFLNLLNDNVLINPGDEKIPTTERDGQNMLDLSLLSEDQRKAIQEILGMNQDELTSALPELKAYVTQRQVQDNSQ